jgi:hypothetical protein
MAVEKKPQPECATLHFTHEWQDKAFHGITAASVNVAKKLIRRKTSAALRHPPNKALTPAVPEPRNDSHCAMSSRFLQAFGTALATNSEIIAD